MTSATSYIEYFLNFSTFVAGGHGEFITILTNIVKGCVLRTALATVNTDATKVEDADPDQ